MSSNYVSHPREAPRLVVMAEHGGGAAAQCLLDERRDDDSVPSRLPRTDRVEEPADDIGTRFSFQYAMARNSCVLEHA
jgi:hypothetical protein